MSLSGPAAFACKHFLMSFVVLGDTYSEILFAKLKEFGPPKIGLNALMGETTKQKLVNVLGHLKSGELELKSGVYKK